MKYYTIGEVYRQGLLLSHKGTPYTAKATVSKLISCIKCKTTITPWGSAKMISEEQIDKLNNRWAKVEK